MHVSLPNPIKCEFNERTSKTLSETQDNKSERSYCTERNKYLLVLALA